MSTRNIKANPEIIHRACIAAVTRKKTLGQWLEEVVAEKVEREQEKKKDNPYQ